MFRPEPVLDDTARAVDAAVPPANAARALRSGERLRVIDRYSTAKAIAAALSTAAPSDHAAKRDHRRAHRAASDNLLVPIDRGRVTLDGAPRIGLLHELYPELTHFHLPFEDVRRLDRAWRHHTQGVHLAVLGHKLHPYYGAYLPSRTEHLELFATWLSQYNGRRQSAVDVGTGSGVLAFLLARAGFSDILATDINPNAIESVRRELGRLDPRPPVRPEVGDLLGEDSQPFDLIVFNPPWIQGEADDLLDRALYYQPELFERFFDRARERIAADGRVVLVFSSVLRLLRPDLPHPIELELEGGRFELVDKLRRRVKPAPGLRTRERVEIWELVPTTA